jgi:hypothetical protein
MREVESPTVSGRRLFRGRVGRGTCDPGLLRIPILGPLHLSPTTPSAPRSRLTKCSAEIGFSTVPSVFFSSVPLSRSTSSLHSHIGISFALFIHSNCTLTVMLTRPFLHFETTQRCPNVVNVSKEISALAELRSVDPLGIRKCGLFAFLVAR